MIWGGKKSQDDQDNFSGGGGGSTFNPPEGEPSSDRQTRMSSYIDNYTAAKKQAQYLPEQPSSYPYEEKQSSGRPTPSVTPGKAKYSQDFADKWMDDSFQAMTGAGGKYAGKYSDIYSMLDSGDYDAWKEWLSYGDPGVGASLFYQTYGDEYKDLLGDDYSKVFGDNGWNDELLRQIFDAEYGKNPSWHSRAAGGDAQAWMDMIGNDQYFGDDWISLMRDNGYGGGWAGYERALKDNPNLTFASWLTSGAADQKQWDDATDFYAKMLFGSDMYSDPGYDIWSQVVDNPLVYGESYPNYSKQYTGDDYYDKWYGTWTNPGTSSSSSGSGVDLSGIDWSSFLSGGLIGAIVNGYKNPGQY